MSFNHPSIITWDYLEKYMAANPSSVLAIYVLEHAAFLDDEPITVDNRWEIDHKKFRQISSDIFGLVKFMIREDGMSNQDNISMPGYELDKLIAEKVLGWKPSTWPGFFSTDIKAAWDLAEKFKLCVMPIGDGWTATQLGQILADSERNKAPTAPHAICLAALFYASEGNE